MPERSLWPPVPRRTGPGAPAAAATGAPQGEGPARDHQVHRRARAATPSRRPRAWIPDRYETWVAAMPGGPLWAEAGRQECGRWRSRTCARRISPWHDLRACLQLVAADPSGALRRGAHPLLQGRTDRPGRGSPGRHSGRGAHVPHPGGARRPVPAAATGVPRSSSGAYASYAHRYVAVAPRLAREAVEQRIAPPGRVVVVPSAVDLASIPVATPTADQGRARDRRRSAAVVGHGRPDRGPEGAARLRPDVRPRPARQRPDVVFVMVGDTTLESRGLEEETRREADRLGVPHPVHRVPCRTRRGWPRPSTSYVVPSRYEGLGRALTEAMASGGPSSPRAVNGVPDLVEPGVTGLLAGAGRRRRRWPRPRSVAARPPRGGRDDGRAGARARPFALRHRDDVPGPRRAVHRAPRTPGPACALRTPRTPGSMSMLPWTWSAVRRSRNTSH